MSLYPLIFKPILIGKPWGGSRLEQVFGRAPAGPRLAAPIGESWDLADFDDARSVIANGPFEGRTLSNVIEEFGEALMGTLALDERTGGFPLLVKFINSAKHLSIQVHPDARYARDHPEARSKNEAWYIIEADPGAVIYRGLNRAHEKDEIRRLVQTSDLEQALERIPVRAGKCYYMPSGTCHAIGPNVLLCEIQTPSDSTFRLYDWGRPETPERHLHIEEALACMHLQPTDVREIEKRSHIAGVFTTVSRLCSCDDFTIEKVRMFEGFGQEISYNRPAVWVVLEGAGTISKTPAKVDVPFGKGDVLLMPACMDDARVDMDADTVWLEVQFPQRLEEQRFA